MSLKTARKIRDPGVFEAQEDLINQSCIMGEWSHLAHILFHLSEAYFAEAESWVQAAILGHEQRRMKWDSACDYIMFAQMLKLKCKGGEETDYLDKSLLLFHECGPEGWRRKIETCFAERQLQRVCAYPSQRNEGQKGGLRLWECRKF